MALGGAVGFAIRPCRDGPLARVHRKLGGAAVTGLEWPHVRDLMRLTACAAAAAILLAALVPGRAEAGRRPYIWVFDTETMARGDLELEQWLWARTRAPLEEGRRTAYWVWWAPVYGLTDWLEIAAPFQILALRGSPALLHSFEADLRFRLTPRDQEGGTSALVRVAYHQSIVARPSRLDANLVVSHELDSRLRFTADVGFQLALPFLDASPAPPELMPTVALGAALPLSDEVRLSAEYFGELPLANLSEQHHFLGASVAYSFGRVWVTAGVLVGLTPLFPATPHFMPRLIWAVAL